MQTLRGECIVSDDNGDERVEFEVVELQSDSGETETYVWVDSLEIGESQYAMMITLERMNELEGMSDEEWLESTNGELVKILRVGEDEFFELSQDEFEDVRDLLTELTQEEVDEDE